MPGRETATLPPQHQERQPGYSGEMRPEPEYEDPLYRGCGKLAGEVAIVTGGDSGIGRAVAIAFAKEGADVAIVYLEEDEDAQATKEAVERQGRSCLTIKGDVSDPDVCAAAVRETVDTFGGLDVLVNNAAQQYEHQDVGEIPTEQIERVFAVNIYSQFYMTKEALEHMREGPPSSTPHPSRRTGASPRCSTTARRRAPSSPSRGRSRCSLRRRASA